MPHGAHHIHARKRKGRSSPAIRTLDRVCMVFSVLMPATAIPQIYKIYSFQIASGVSLLMWVLYSIAVVPFLIYGIVHRAAPLIVLNALWLIVNVIVITGVLLYG